MPQSKFTEAQAIATLREADASCPINRLLQQTMASALLNYYKWKTKYHGRETPDVKRLKELEHENRRLTQLYADLSLGNTALRNVIMKNL